ncbi:alpha/beta hydrolase [Micromonospora sp. NPDC049645]|uniref:alpha/beta fold hydrolase n=1 Tax=Micromonospora sp. NPDC049645 TaxID=3155508 RepID=UPI003420C33E
MDVRVRSNVTVTGRDGGPVVMLAHGFGCDQNMWRHITTTLGEQSRVLLFDHVGAGRSDLTAWDSDRYATLDGYARDVLDICRDLDLRDVIFVGHSVSAMIGVLAVTEQPDRFAGLVLLTPSPCYIDEEGYRGGFTREDIDELLDSLDSNYLGWSASMAPMIMGNADRPELGDELTASFCRSDPTIAKAFARVTFLSDHRADLGRVRVPTLVIQSAIDAIAPPEVGAYVKDQIAGSRLVTLDATGHCPQLSAPQATAQAIAAFVAERR